MDDPPVVDLFAEDRAHEEFISALIRRLARQHAKDVDLRIRSARGGHGRVLAELKLYQQSIRRQLRPARMPAIVVVAVDANCDPFASAREKVRKALLDDFAPLAAIACPDPHVERWYLADPASFHCVVGIAPPVERRKCGRDRYKSILAQTIQRAGHPPTLGGIEFARELAQDMDFYRAGKREKSLKSFIAELNLRLAGL